jgi:hypothetical protein
LQRRLQPLESRRRAAKIILEAESEQGHPICAARSKRKLFWLDVKRFGLKERQAGLSGDWREKRSFHHHCENKAARVAHADRADAWPASLCMQLSAQCAQGYRNRARFACREIIKLFSNTQNWRFQQAQHWILKGAPKKEWHDNVKTAIRDPLCKLDSLMREARQLMQENDAGSIALSEERDRIIPCCKCLLGEALDCANDSAHYARPWYSADVNESLCEGNFSLFARAGILA